MTRKQVFLLATSLNMGGTESFLVKLVERLCRDYDITVGYFKEKGFWGDYLEKQGVPVLRFTSFPCLVTYLRKNKPTILHTFLYRANILGRAAARLAGVPGVISTQQAIDAWKKRRHVLLDRWSAAWCDVIIANAATTKELLTKRERIPAAKIRVVYNGLDFRRFVPRVQREEFRRSLGIPAQAAVVASVLRLHPEKGADLLPEIVEKTPGALFLVAGDGPTAAGIRDEVRRRNLEERMRFTGWRQDIADLLNASDVFLLPSREESFPQAVLEAMAMRLPVVASRVGGMEELVDDGTTGILVSPGAAEPFAAALRSLLADGAKARAMGDQGFRKSRRFDEHSMIESVRAVYQDVLQRKSA
jgi:glycosyltransferase involved in cell wall biosynthesis